MHLCPLLCLSRRVSRGGCLHRQEACLPRCAPPRSLSFSPQVLPMTPPGRLYLLRVCSTPPLLLLLGLLLALPPEAQVRQQDQEGRGGRPSPTLGLKACLTPFSPRGSVALASHPQLHSNPRSPSPVAPSNPLLTLLVNIHPPSRHVAPSPPPAPYRDPITNHPPQLTPLPLPLSSQPSLGTQSSTCCLGD